MPDSVVRFTVSVPPDLLAQFDEVCAGKGYASRSEAVRDSIRDYLVGHTWTTAGAEGDQDEVIGTLTLLCDTTSRRLSEELRERIGRNPSQVVTTLQAPVDSDTSLEVAVVRGNRADVMALADEIISLRGVKHGRLVAAAANGKLK